MAGIEHRNKTFMKADTDLVLKNRETYRIEQRKIKRAKHSAELRSKLSGELDVAYYSEINFKKLSNNSSQYSICKKIIEKNIVEKLIEACDSDGSFDKKLQALKIFSLLVEPGGPFQYGLFYSIASAIKDFIETESSLLPISLSVLARLSMEHCDLIWEVGMANIVLSSLSNSNSMFILQRFSWYDNMSEVLIKNNVLDQLSQVMFLELKYTLMTLLILSNFASASYFAVNQLISHRIFDYVLDLIDSTHEKIRDECSYVLFYLTVNSDNSQKLKILAKINQGQLQNAIEQKSRIAVVNYAKIFLELFYKNSMILVPYTVFEEFIYDKCKEVSDLSSEIVNLFN